MWSLLRKADAEGPVLRLSRRGSIIFVTLTDRLKFQILLQISHFAVPASMLPCHRQRARLRRILLLVKRLGGFHAVL